jgi:hypothetical protein
MLHNGLSHLFQKTWIFYYSNICDSYFDVGMFLSLHLHVRTTLISPLVVYQC